MEAKEECFEFKSARRYQIDALLRRLQRSSRSGIRFLRLRRVGDSEASLNDRISGAVYSLDLTDDDVAAALEARKILLGARTVDDADFIRNSLADFIARNVGSQLAFRLDPDEGKLFLELPALSRRGLRPQDIVSAVIGLDTPSVRLTRERLIFRLGAERSARVSAD
jgi:hypothetical protein